MSANMESVATVDNAAMMPPPGEGAVFSRSRLRALPKVELHAHLGGSVSQEKLMGMLEQELCVACDQELGGAEQQSPAAAAGGGNARIQQLKALQTSLPVRFPVDMQNSPVQIGPSCSPDDHKAVMCKCAADALASCFEYFKVKDALINNLDSLRESSEEAFESYLNNGCIYVEMRFSPKKLGGGRWTKMDYMQTVVQAMRNAEARFRGGDGGSGSKELLSRRPFALLPSMDRGKVDTLDDARQQVLDIYELYDAFPDIVRGMDVSGNPARPSLFFVLDAIEEAVATRRRSGEAVLPVAFHLGEHPSDEEIDAVFDRLERLNVRRLGHCTYFQRRHVERVAALSAATPSGGGRQSGRTTDTEATSPKGGNQNGTLPFHLGIEFCPTSNRVTSALSSLREHHFHKWREWLGEEVFSLLKMTLNADDVGLFSNDLTLEFQEAAPAFGLTEADVVRLVFNAVDTAFLTEEERAELRQEVAARLKQQGWPTHPSPPTDMV